MKKAKIIAFHKCIGNCTITELEKDDKRYFKAKICGWDNFKFTSDTLKAQELFNIVLKEVAKIKELIEKDVNNLDDLPTNFKF